MEGSLCSNEETRDTLEDLTLERYRCWHVFIQVGYLVHVADGEGRERNLPDWLGVTVKAHQHRGGVSFVEHLAKV